MLEGYKGSGLFQNALFVGCYREKRPQLTYLGREVEKDEEIGQAEALNHRGVGSHQRTEDSNNGGNELNDNLQNGKHGFDDGDEKREEGTCRANRENGNNVSNSAKNELSIR